MSDTDTDTSWNVIPEHSRILERLRKARKRQIEVQEATEKRNAEQLRRIAKLCAEAKDQGVPGPAVADAIGSSRGWPHKLVTKYRAGEL